MDNKARLLQAVETCAIRYCLAALRQFEAMTDDEIGKVISEICDVRLSAQGFDVFDPAERYTLPSLPGPFDALKLGAYLYVAVQKLDLNTDTGLDLSREYKVALALYDNAAK